MDLNDLLKKIISGKSTKSVLLFLLLASMQFLYFWSNYGPLTSCDPDLHVPGAYGLASGQSFNQNLLTFDPIEVDGSFSNNTQYLYLPENISSHDNRTYRNGTLSSLLGAQNDEMRGGQKSELIDIEKSRNIVKDNTGVNSYYPLSWVAPALGMKVGMLLGKSSWGILQLARISNFLFYCGIMISAIIILPRGKLVLSTIASFPMSVFVASSIMSDAFLIALCALYVSVALYFIYNNSAIKKWHMLGIAIITLLLMLAKTPYGSLALFFIFMPKDIWKLKPKIITCSITLVVFLLLYLPWVSTFQSMHIAPNVDYSEQLSYFAHHFASVLFNCLVNSLVFLSVVVPFQYTQFGLFVVVVIGIILVNYKQKLNLLATIAIVAPVLTMMATYLFEFLTWNNYQGIMPHFLGGFQERYLLPMLPLLLVFCQNQKLPAVPQGIDETNITKNSLTSVKRRIHVRNNVPRERRRVHNHKLSILG